MAMLYLPSSTRQEGRGRFTHIPAEIYMLILDSLYADAEDLTVAEQKSLLRPLNLVCRLFRILIAPKLFSTMVLKGPAEGVIHRTTWLGHLTRGDERACQLSSHVRKLEIIDWLSPTHHAMLPDLSQYVRILPRFPNLRCLSLSHIAITPALYDAVAAMDKLDSLSVRDCTFSAPGGGTIDPSASYLPRLTSVDLSLVDGIEPYVTALASLAATPALRSLRTTVWPFGRAVIERATVSCLEHLDVPFVPQDAGFLLAYLDRAPTITELTIGTPDDVERMVGPCKPLQRTSLPLLERLRCPMYLLPTILQNYRVSRLSVVDFNDWFASDTAVPIHEQLLRPMTRLTTLKELEIPSSLLYTCPLQQFAPKLTDLSICFPLLASDVSLEKITRDLCRYCSGLPLQTIALHFFHVIWKLDLSLQHRMLSTLLGSSCSSVTRVSFDDAITWRLSGTTKQAEWVPVVCEREQVKALLQTHVVDDSPWEWMALDVSDYKGVLAALFKGEEISPAVAKRLGGHRPGPRIMTLPTWTVY